MDNLPCILGAKLPDITILNSLFVFSLISLWWNVWRVSSFKSHSLCPNSKVAVTDWLTDWLTHWPKSGIELPGQLKTRCSKKDATRCSINNTAKFSNKDVVEISNKNIKRFLHQRFPNKDSKKFIVKYATLYSSKNITIFSQLNWDDLTRLPGYRICLSFARVENLCYNFVKIFMVH